MHWACITQVHDRVFRQNNKSKWGFVTSNRAHPLAPSQPGTAASIFSISVCLVLKTPAAKRTAARTSVKKIANRVRFIILPTRIDSLCA